MAKTGAFNIMNLLHVTDPHFQKRQLDWVWQQRHSVDAVCISGDLLDPSIHAAPLAEQIGWYQAWLAAWDRPLFVCTGNHDMQEESLASMSLEELFFGSKNGEDSFTHDFRWLLELKNPNLVRDGEIRKIGKYRIGCIGYENYQFLRFAKCDVILTHLPPLGSGVSLDITGEDFGCGELQFALKYGAIAPKYLLAGHIHQPKKNLVKMQDTWISNPGSSPEGDIPKHRIITL